MKTKPKPLRLEHADDYNMSLVDVAKEIGITMGGAWVIEQRALRKLAKAKLLRELAEAELL